MSQLSCTIRTNPTNLPASQATELSQWHWHQQQVSQQVARIWMCFPICFLWVLSSTAQCEYLQWVLVWVQAWVRVWVRSTENSLHWKHFYFQFTLRHYGSCSLFGTLMCGQSFAWFLLSHISISIFVVEKCINYTSFSTSEFQLKPRQSLSTTAVLKVFLLHWPTGATARVKKVISIGIV